MGKASILIAERQSEKNGWGQPLEQLGYEIFGTVHTAADAIIETVQTKPNVVLIDTELDGEFAGIEAARRIRTRIEVAIVFVTERADIATVDRAKAADPCGYLVRPCELHQLQAMIELGLHRQEKAKRMRKVVQGMIEALNYHEDPVFMSDHSGRLTFVNGAARDMLDRTGTPVSRSSVLWMLANRKFNETLLPNGLGELSSREQEVLGWFLQGFGTETIGARLHLSPQTVRNHLKNVCRKMNVNSQIQLRELFAEQI